MNHLQKAIAHISEDIPSPTHEFDDVYESDVEKAKVHALISIAESLHFKNEAMVALNNECHRIAEALDTHWNLDLGEDK